MVAAGTTVQFVVQGNVSTWSPVELDPANLRERIITALQANRLTVKSVTLQATSWALGGLLEYTYQARIAVASQSSHGQIGDIGAIVGNAVYNATGRMPTVIPSGDPLDPGDPDPDAGDPLAWLRNLASTLGTTVTVVAVAAIVVGVVILREK